MSDWKAAEAQECGDFLYMEEVNSNEGESRRITVSMTNTVKDLKQSIASSLGNPQGWNAVGCAFGERELSDLTASLDSFGIQDGDTIFFTRAVTPAAPKTADPPPPYAVTKTLDNVMFQDTDGKTFTVNFIPVSWKIAALREKLGREKALEVDYYRFIYGGKQLDYERTLADYNMGDNCTIHLVMRLRGGGETQ